MRRDRASPGDVFGSGSEGGVGHCGDLVRMPPIQPAAPVTDAATAAAMVLQLAGVRTLQAIKSAAPIAMPVKSTPTRQRIKNARSVGVVIGVPPPAA